MTDTPNDEAEGPNRPGRPKGTSKADEEKQRNYNIRMPISMKNLVKRKGGAEFVRELIKQTYLPLIVPEDLVPDVENYAAYVNKTPLEVLRGLITGLPKVPDVEQEDGEE